MSNGKRLGIYAMYCPAGVVDEYILYYLSQIKECLSELAVVSNTALTKESKGRLEKYADYIFEREDREYDVGALRSVLSEFLGWDRIRAYYELVLMNDSVFGPFYPFQETFDKMDQRGDLDFWGLCERGRSDFDGGEIIFPEHIQLYFYVVRKKMLCSEAFENFWNGLEGQIDNFRTAIFKYEFAFTKYFEDKGFRWDVSCHLNEYESPDPKMNLSPYHYGSYRLIKNHRCPVLKRKLFTGDFVRMKYSGREDLSRVFRFIREETDYDEGLIWSYILSHYRLNDIIESMKLCYTLEVGGGTDCKNSRGRISLLKYSVAHTEFDSLFDDVHILCKAGEGYNDLVLVFPGSFGGNPECLNESERYRIRENLVRNGPYITKIIELFDNNPRLGILAPPEPFYGMVSKNVLSSWENLETTKRLYQKLNLRAPLDEDRQPLSSITAFWCRRDILTGELAALMAAEKPEELTPLIPLYAQDLGYYSAYVQSSDYAGIDYYNNRRFLYDLLRQLDVGTSMDYDDVLDKIQEIRLQEFCDKNGRIVVYGAGQLAQRAAGALKKLGKNFEFYVVTELSDNARSLCGHVVYGINEIALNGKDTGILVAVGRNHNKQVVSDLKKRGFHRLMTFQN